MKSEMKVQNTCVELFSGNPHFLTEHTGAEWAKETIFAPALSFVLHDSVFDSFWSSFMIYATGYGTHDRMMGAEFLSVPSCSKLSIHPIFIIFLNSLKNFSISYSFSLGIQKYLFALSVCYFTLVDKCVYLLFTHVVFFVYFACFGVFVSFLWEFGLLFFHCTKLFDLFFSLFSSSKFFWKILE